MSERLQISYTVVELGVMLDRDPRTVARWLDGLGVPVTRVGRDRCVWLADLVHHVPAFERSLLIKREYQRAG
jgi:hypothetical protein